MAKEEDKEIEKISLPYNFIPFPDKWVYPYDLRDDMKKPPSYINNNQGADLSGYIEYTITPKSDLILDLRKDMDENYFVMGSTLRGRVRNNLEILSFSYPTFIDKRPMIYRDFTSNDNRSESYEKRLGIDNKKIEQVMNVGYLIKKGNKFYVKEAKEIGGKKFYPIDETKLIEWINQGDTKNCYNTMYDWNRKEKQWLKELNKKIEDLTIKIKEYRKDNNIDNNKYSSVFIEKGNFNRWHLKYKSEEKIKKIIEEKSDMLYNELKKINKEHCDLFKLYKERIKYKARIYAKIMSKETRRSFRPYQRHVFYNNSQNRGVSHISFNTNNTIEYLEGTLFCSTNASSKRRHYLVGKIKEDGNCYGIEDNLINVYNDNMERFRISKGSKETKNQIKEFYNIFNSYSDLKEKNNYPVVFFTLNKNGDEITNIGRTPYLKIQYKNSLDNLLKEEKHNKIDYVRGLFGYTKEDLNIDTNEIEDGRYLSYKSRLRFSPIDIKGKLNEEDLDTRVFNLQTPQATAFQMYLKQDNAETVKDIKSYEDDCQLRGYKFYKILNKTINPIKDKKEKGDDLLSEKIVIPMKKDINLKGRIYFNNLTEEELGLLMLSVDIKELQNESELIKKEETYDLIGGAKPYGYGKVKIDIDSVNVLENKSIFDMDFEKNHYTEKSYDEKKNYITKYTNKMDRQIDERKDYLKTNTIETYIRSKTIIKDKCNVKYNWNNKRGGGYKKEEVLATVDELIKGKNEKSNYNKYDRKSNKNKGNNNYKKKSSKNKKHQSRELNSLKDNEVLKKLLKEIDR
ncbi:hypothetical protein [Dethiothermospora halolimnae]|uniref:hypothetical protein n=1 Tax=Dethiothermospora halolimnae TaxID=3114390 RepID=UPI003CCC26B9